MTRQCWLSIAASAIGACSLMESGESVRKVYVNSEQHYAVFQPDGWTPTSVRGSAQFAPSNGAKKRHTIIVRAAEKPQAMFDGKPPTREGLIAATKTALNALPSAKLSSVSAVEGAEMPGSRFSLTFIPRKVKARYRREDAVLVGSRRVFHVIYTAPVDEPIDEQAFASMVSSLTEEGV